jgi:esterase/lipase
MKKYLIYIGSFVLALVLTFIINTHNEIAIETPEGTIFGEILNAGNENLVIFTAGSGPTDRDGNSKYLDGKNNSLIGLANELKNSGISTFRYDKRAVGKSLKTFDIKNIVFEDFVEDLTNIIKYFRNEGTYNKIYLLGHSQGSLESVLAAQKEIVDGVIYLAGPARYIDQVFIEQLENQEENEVYKEMLYTVKRLQKDRKVSNDDINESQKKILNIENQTFLLSWMKYNPVDEVKKIKTPIIFIYGDTDTQATTKEMDVFIKAMKNPNYKVIGQMNHVLKESPEDKRENEKRYIDPSYKIHPQLAPTIVNFVKDAEHHS